MTTTKDLLNTKQNTLLTELESIKNLLDGQEADNIPLLQDTFVPKEPESEIQTIPSITEGVLPGQRSLFNEHKLNAAKPNPKIKSSKASLTTFANSLIDNSVPITPNSNNNTTSTNRASSANSLSNNPFLPAHVRQRLQRDANNEQSNDNDKRLATVNSS
jgi:hypothetical protein